ncbi:MAG: serine hydrolase domain-containing protein, partial [Gemmatimonadota bacterium]
GLSDRYPDAPPVTVQGILTHSSGLPRESDFAYWSAPYPFPTRAELMDRLSTQEELYPAFDRFQYSNLGLSLAGEIIAATTGVGYHDYMRSNVLEPLGMSSTYTEIPAEERGKKMAIGYTAQRRDGTRAEVALFQARGIAPAAGYASTVLDLAKFASWQFRTLEGPGGEVLARNTLAEMHRVHWLNPDWELKWGLGFATWRVDDRTHVGHGGGCPGFITHFDVEPKGKIATVFLSNANGTASSMFTRRMHEIVGPAIRAAIADAHGEPTSDAEDGVSGDPDGPADMDEAVDLGIYTGTYDAAPWGGEQIIVPWQGGLAALSLPTMNPAAGLVKLKKSGEHTFRRVQSDGELAEEWRFEIGEDGRASRVWVHSNFNTRVSGTP